MIPRRLNSQRHRQTARRVRDGHWEFMERLAIRGVLHVCLWNKYGQKERRNEVRLCLISGVELMDWVRKHRAWFGYGRCDLNRHTFPMWLTPQGRLAAKRRTHDGSPVEGGLVEPGFQVTPAQQFHRSLHEQISRRHRARRPGEKEVWVSPYRRLRRVEETPPTKKRRSRRKASA